MAYKVGESVQRAVFPTKGDSARSAPLLRDFASFDESVFLTRLFPILYSKVYNNNKHPNSDLSPRRELAKDRPQSTIRRRYALLPLLTRRNPLHPRLDDRMALHEPRSAHLVLPARRPAFLGMPIARRAGLPSSLHPLGERVFSRLGELVEAETRGGFVRWLRLLLLGIASVTPLARGP